MKIGIMTVPFNNNYGGFLQAFALKHTLVEMGHEVVFVIRRRDYQRVYVNRWKNLICYLFRKDASCQFLTDYKQNKLSKYTNKFVNKYLKPFTKECYRSKDLDAIRNSDIDLYIAGSDQCWRAKFAPTYIDDYFFKFLKGSNKKRISYAASFGTDEFEFSPKMQESCTELLQEFSAISVRESSAIPLLENYFNVPRGFAQAVLDPTFLPSTEVYRQLTEQYPVCQKKYLFTYILDENTEKRNLINSLLQLSGLTEVTQKAQTSSHSGKDPIAPIELWLSRIIHADFVVTDSFHGMVFSILFNKPFAIINNPARGTSRIETLLKIFELQSRIIDVHESNPRDLIQAKIDWDSVNRRIEKEKKLSLNFLKQSLS